MCLSNPLDHAMSFLAKGSCGYCMGSSETAAQHAKQRATDDVWKRVEREAVAVSSASAVPVRVRDTALQLRRK